jgi:hypothetical protein
MKKPVASITLYAILLLSFKAADHAHMAPRPVTVQVRAILERKILAEAAWAMQQQPVTVMAASSPRSAGGKHDFYSEGDYWWPDPANPSGPYIQRDGLSNPGNFTAHRLAMIRFSKIIGALASAYKVTHNNRYVKQAILHLNAWFVNRSTLMNPGLQYAQAIKGITTGRGIGIIDTIQLMEVAQGILVMERSEAMPAWSAALFRNWFSRYNNWLCTSKNGQDEKAAKNNHGTCWTMQVASFAKLCGDKALMDYCRSRFKSLLLPGQMAADGSFPLELARTKPYGYSIFNLDAMATLCQILSEPGNDLWSYETGDGRSVKKGIEWMHPFITDKSGWVLKPDVMYWADWPVAQPFLVFGANAYKRQDWLDTWKTLDHDPQVEEVIRNLPVRHPLIWLN